MKKLLSTFIILVMLIATIPMTVGALTEGDWEYQVLNNEILITKYIGTDENVIVPDTIRNLPVTAMEGELFRFNGNVKSIKFPSTMKSIPGKLFWCASGLETAIISEGTTTIEDNAFYTCKNLKKVVLPSTIKTIGNYAFVWSPLLSDVVIPKGVEAVGYRAFSGTAIEKVDLSGTNFELQSDTFQGCEKLTEIILPENIKKIPMGLLNGCSSLKSIVIPNSVTEIGYSAFSGTGLTNIVLPISLKTIDGYAFSGTSLKEIIIPYGVETIEEMILYGCKELEYVYIPNSVTKIEHDLLYESPNAIVYCAENSFAQKYCQKNNTSYMIDNSVDAGINVLYNGKRISFHTYNQTPEIINGRTLVPLRSIFEAMGATVEWDDNTSTAIAKRNGTEIKVQIGANQIYKNGTPISVDVPSQIMNGRTMVPARVVAEAFGADVDWNGNGRIVLITE